MGQGVAEHRRRWARHKMDMVRAINKAVEAAFEGVAYTSKARKQEDA